MGCGFSKSAGAVGETMKQLLSRPELFLAAGGLVFVLFLPLKAALGLLLVVLTLDQAVAEVAAMLPGV